MRIVIFSVLLSGLLMFPALTEAAQLVPVACDNPANCGTCEFVQLTNNVIQYIIVIASLVAIGIFFYAGVLLIISGGNEEAVKKAKSYFTNVVIGYVLILGAFIFVDLILSSLLPNNSSVLNWKKVQCIYPSAVNEPVRSTSVNNSLQVGSDNPRVTSTAGACNPELLQPIFGSRTAAAACIAQAESTCGASFFSRTDLDANKVPFSLSPWQINLTVHEVVGCGETLDCKGAYEGKDYNAKIVDRSLYNKCVKALSDVQCAAKNADRIQKQSGWKAWSTAGKCNL